MFSRRRFMGALLAGVSSTALVPCDPGVVGHMFISEDQVTQMGIETWERMRAEMPASRDGGYQQRSRQVTARILRAVGEDPAAWEVEVFARPEANAFALPGNKIGLFEGMCRFTPDDSQLAAVVGHEIGLRNMARAGYDPRGAIQLWENMRQEGARPPEFLSTHPAPDARIRALEALMPEALEIYRASA